MVASLTILIHYNNPILSAWRLKIIPRYGNPILQSVCDVELPRSFLDRVGFARSIMSLQELDPSVNGSLCSIDLLFGKRLKLK
jgi:hypothetical protein